MNQVIKTEEKYINLFDDLQIEASTESIVIFPIKSGNKKYVDNTFTHTGHPSISTTEKNTELFNPHVPDIKKYFSMNGYNIEIIRDSKKQVKYEILYDNEIILPVLFFIGNGALTIGLNMLSNFLYEKYFGSNRKIKADIIEMETDKIKASRYKIEGDAEYVIKAIKELKDK